VSVSGRDTPDRLVAGRDELAAFCTDQQEPLVVDACLRDVVGAWDARIDAVEAATPLLAAIGVQIGDGKTLDTGPQ